MPHAHGDITHDHPDPTPGHTHDDAADRESDVADRESDVADRDADTDRTTAEHRTAGPTNDEEAPPTAAPAHTDTTVPTEAPAAAAPGTAVAGVSGWVLRAVLTVLGAAAMAGGAFLVWFVGAGEPVTGTQTPIKILWSVSDLFRVGFWTSAGLLVIVLGILALVGLALRTGWLTRLAGALGIIVFVLFLITLYRIPEIELGIQNIGVGMWLVLLGGVLAVVGGFFGPRTRGERATVPA